jgi:hypothetical protein
LLLYTGKCLEGFFEDKEKNKNKIKKENFEANQLRFFNLSPVYEYISRVFKDLLARRLSIAILCIIYIAILPKGQIKL